MKSGEKQNEWNKRDSYCRSTKPYAENNDDPNKLVNLFNILNHSIKEGAATDYVKAVVQELKKNSDGLTSQNGDD